MSFKWSLIFTLLMKLFEFCTYTACAAIVSHNPLLDSVSLVGLMLFHDYTFKRPFYMAFFFYLISVYTQIMRSSPIGLNC